MARAGIRDRCRVDVSENEDSFVGIRCGTDEISVQFPLGFRVSSDDKELRRDILLLLSAIGGTTAKRESKLPGLAGQYSVTAFPIQAYVAVAQDFFSRGRARRLLGSGDGERFIGAGLLKIGRLLNRTEICFILISLRGKTPSARISL